MSSSKRFVRRFANPARGLIYLIGIIVPQGLRRDWRQEWEAELQHREMMLSEWDNLNWRNKGELLKRSLGAFRDALLLQPQRLEDEMFQDVRFGVRRLLKTPGFTLIAVLTLALGIGATTAIFSVVNTVLLRPLPFKEPDRLVMVRETKFPQFSEFAVSPANFLDWQQQNTVFEQLVGVRPVTVNLTGTGDPERLNGATLTDGFGALLGVTPQLGRDFLSEENQVGRNNVVLLSHNLWQRRFGGEPDIINQKIILDGQPYTVVGVMPAGFKFLEWQSELWIPLAFTPQQAQNRGGHNISLVVGRLKPDITHEMARVEMSALASRLEMQYPEVNAGWNVILMPLLDATVRTIKPALLLLLAAVAFVLVIACVNVANLLLAKAAVRQREIAIRTALGAGRFRIIRQLLTESVLLAIVGGTAGLLLANWGLQLLLQLAPQDLPRVANVSLDARVLAFSAVITLLTGILFGLVPALHASKPNLQEPMKDASRGLTAGGNRQRMRSSLVVVEIAAALVLLVGAGLMLKSFWRLLQVDPGFAPEQALTMTVALPQNKYGDGTRQTAFFQQLLDNVKALPGVESVGAASHIPLDGNDSVVSYEVKGQPPAPPGSFTSANYFIIEGDYFGAMGIPLRKGRVFSEHDTKDAPLVVMINETFARKNFPDENPIGKSLNFDSADNPVYREIIGVVGDVKYYGLDREATQQLYFPASQEPERKMTLVARTAGDPLALTTAIRNQVHHLDKNQPVSDIKTLAQLVSTSIVSQRFSIWLLGIFATVALVLAAVGIYGVLSYVVAQRTHEIGIRMALGAGRREVFRLVVGHGMQLTMIGVVAGLSVAFVLTRLMATLLFNVSATDPLTYTLIGLLLVVVALLACYIPARRATRVDPLVALRHE
ncbi:MAG: ABC transporter permease [Acidobacteriota bacterium]